MAPAKLELDEPFVEGIEGNNGTVGERDAKENVEEGADGSSTSIWVL